MSATQSSGRIKAVINRRASRADDFDLNALSLAFDDSDADLQIDLVEEPAHMPDALERGCDDCSSLLIGGGDGTLSQCLPRLLELNMPVGILPLGTANDLARGLGLPDDPLEAARVVAAGHTRRIDIGVANDVPFFNAAGIGLGPALTEELSYEEKRRWGIVAYARAGWRALQRQGQFRATIECDGKSHNVHTVQITIANGLYYGGGMLADADAQFDDGTLNVLSIKPDSFIDLLRLAPAARAGEAGRDPEVLHLRGEEVDVRTQRPMEVTTDGEPTTETPLTVSVRRLALEVYCSVPDS